jgi:hypothetical protein
MSRPPERFLLHGALSLAQPRARSPVLRFNENDAGLFKRALNRFDSDCPRSVRALEVIDHGA